MAPAVRPKKSGQHECKASASPFASSIYRSVAIKKNILHCHLNTKSAFKHAALSAILLIEDTVLVHHNTVNCQPWHCIALDQASLYGLNANARAIFVMSYPTIRATGQVLLQGLGYY
eukprot:scaffold240995_cov40-Prasinocladus_malaysianus.AAC.1